MVSVRRTLMHFIREILPKIITLDVLNIKVKPIFSKLDLLWPKLLCKAAIFQVQFRLKNGVLHKALDIDVLF